MKEYPDFAHLLVVSERQKLSAVFATVFAAVSLNIVKLKGRTRSTAIKEFIDSLDNSRHKNNIESSSIYDIKGFTNRNIDEETQIRNLIKKYQKDGFEGFKHIYSKYDSAGTYIYNKNLSSDYTLVYGSRFPDILTVWRPLTGGNWTIVEDVVLHEDEDMSVNHGKAHLSFIQNLHTKGNVFELDNENVQGAHISDQLSTIIAVVQNYRDNPLLEWNPIDIRNSDGEVTRLDSLAEASEYCNQTIGLTAASHSARAWLEGELEMRRAAAMEAKRVYTAIAEPTDVDKDAYFEAEGKNWRLWDWKAALKDRTEYAAGLHRVRYMDLEKELRRAKETIEHLASHRRRWIVNALDEQGSHLDASCGSQADAMMQLSNIKQNAFGVLDVHEDNLSEIRRYLGIYQKQIRELEVRNSPDFFKNSILNNDRIEYDWQPLNSSDVTLKRIGTEFVELPLDLRVVNPIVEGEDLGPIAISTTQPLYKSGVRSNWKVLRRPGLNGSVSVLYKLDAEDENADPAKGTHRIVITARNKCGPSDVILDILNPEHLIADTNFETLKDSSTSSWRAPANAVYDKAETALKFVDNDGGEDWLLQSELFRVDANSRYHIQVTAKQPAGDRKNHLFVQFYLDRRGEVPVTAHTVAGRPEMIALGWESFGTACYWANAFTVFPNDWTTFEHTFGREGVGEIPYNSKSFRVGAILSAGGTSETTVLLKDFQLMRL